MQANRLTLEKFIRRIQVLEEQVATLQRAEKAKEVLGGTKIYYVADSSGGAVTRKLTFKDGLLQSET